MNSSALFVVKNDHLNIEAINVFILFIYNVCIYKLVPGYIMPNNNNTIILYKAKASRGNH